MLYPFIFEPLFKERVWGGRRIAELYDKSLPIGRPIGESWEISDRPGDVSVIKNGPLAGRDLHWLVTNHWKELFGNASSVGQVSDLSPASVSERAVKDQGPRPSGPNPDVERRFPWLIKILDAQDKLSLQVHPPAEIAAEMGGEPKTEMWYVAAATPDADIFAGLKRGVSRADFERKTADGTVAECFHRIEVKPGDCMFLRSGRVHALGAGSVIFEIQQNSDTTYRVFDWNRVGLDGKPRDLHIEQSMRSIDFADFEPKLVPPKIEPAAFGSTRPLVDDPLFRVMKIEVRPGNSINLENGAMQVVGLLNGSAKIASRGGELEIRAGQFVLIPAAVSPTVIKTDDEVVEFLWVRPGK